MLQGRLFAYGDAHRYRLGINHTQLPVNRPQAVPAARTTTAATASCARRNGGAAKNYEPNSFGGPVADGRAALTRGSRSTAARAATPGAEHAEDNDFVQAGELYRLMCEEEKQRLVANIAGAFRGLPRRCDPENLGHFHAADPDYGERVAKAVQALKARTRGEEVTIQVASPRMNRARLRRIRIAATLLSRGSESRRVAAFSRC